MKVAIMGAGLSGLSCAIMLERNGIKPTIFEKRSRVGDRFINGEAMLSILTRPVNDPYRYFSEVFQLDLKPSSPINQLVIHSENAQAVIDEQIGFVNIRGRHHNSFENQLAEQVSSVIHFNSTLTYEQLAEEYTHVILATGDASYAIGLKNYREDVSVSIKGATVKGKFDRYQTSVWINHHLAPKGYGYLLPFSETEANIAIAHPDLSDDKTELVDTFWDRFYERVCSDLNQSLKITDQFQISNYQIGMCKQPRIGNTFYTGNNFGTIMPFLGFGQYEAILTGIFAAYDICGLGRYEDLTNEFRKSYQHSWALHRLMENQDNHTYDRIVKLLDGYVGERVFQSSSRNPLKMVSYLARLFVLKNGQKSPGNGKM